MGDCNCEVQDLTGRLVDRARANGMKVSTENSTIYFVAIQLVTFVLNQRALDASLIHYPREVKLIHLPILFLGTLSKYSLQPRFKAEPGEE